MAANTKQETIAICDRDLHKVVIIDYKGRILGFYKGYEANIMPCLYHTGEFEPISVCSTKKGDFIVSGQNKDYPFVLTPLGKFIGILRLHSLAHFREISAMWADNEQNVWTGHLRLGTIGILTPKVFKNDFCRIQLPRLHQSNNAI